MSFRIVKLLDSLNNVVIVGGIVPKGAYAAGTDYAVGDMVSYTDGASYVMYVDASAGTAPTDATKWMVVAEKGATGDAGADSTVAGPTGPDGVAGADGLPVELQSNDPFIQWRVSGDPDWINLIALADITGPQGIEGPAGPAGYTHPNHSGDVTSVADGATTIANNAVTYAKMQNVSATSRVLGRITTGSGDVEELTGANIRTIASAPEASGFAKITVASSAPGSPTTGDLWVDST